MSSSQLILLISTVVLISSMTLIIYVRIQQSQANKSSVINNKTIEYAPHYSVREKLFLVGKNLMWLIPVLVVLNHLIVKEPDQNFTELCFTFWGFNGFQLYIYGLIFIPALILLVCCVIGFLFWRKVIKYQQYPIPNQKVFKRTRVVKGAKARLRATFAIMGGVLLMILMVIFTTISVDSFSPLVNDEQINHICHSTEFIDNH